MFNYLVYHTIYIYIEHDIHDIGNEVYEYIYIYIYIYIYSNILLYYKNIYLLQIL